MLADTYLGERPFIWLSGIEPVPPDNLFNPHDRVGGRECLVVEYVLLKDIKRDVILRHNRESNSDQAYVCHSHPFTSLPYLKSHIRSQFVIFNAGLKLLKAIPEKGARSANGARAATN